MLSYRVSEFTFPKESKTRMLWKDVALCMPVAPTGPTWLLAYPPLDVLIGKDLPKRN